MQFRLRSLTGGIVETVHAINVEAALKHAKMTRFSPPKTGAFKGLVGYAFHGKTQYSITRVD